jgi:hypothetical protein
VPHDAKEHGPAPAGALNGALTGALADTLTEALDTMAFIAGRATPPRRPRPTRRWPR